MEPPSSTIRHSIAKEPRAKVTLRGAHFGDWRRGVSVVALSFRSFSHLGEVRRNAVWLVSELHLCAAWGRTFSSPRGARRHISQNSRPMWCYTSPSCCSSRC
jgi:hypothetical protein